jgi:hypothetical protein
LLTAYFIGFLFSIPARAIIPTEALIGKIVESECDSESPDYVAPNMAFSNCVHVTYLAPLTTRRFWVAPGGQVNFEFWVLLSEMNRTTTGVGGIPGPQLHANYTITVTATDVSNSANTATNSTSVTLYGSQATDAPPGANVDNGYQYMLQASPGTEAFAFVTVPVNVDWAESYVSFSVQSSQSANQNAVVENCHTQDPSGGLNCVGSWLDSGTIQAPSLANVNSNVVLNGMVPAANQFVMVTVPSVAAQLPVVPMAIVYAPLGNSASSSYSITTSTASTIQFGNSTVTETDGSSTTDDKISYGGTLDPNALLTFLGTSVPGNILPTLQYSGSQEWNTQVQTTNQNTYGMTSSVASASQLTDTFPNNDCFNPSGPNLNQVNYYNQPFWCDQIIVAADSQFAVWDYPAGPIIQPLGSLGIDSPTISQLDQCANNSLPQTAAPIANNAISISHFLVLPSATGTAYIWLSSQDCATLASFDQFYVKKSQSALPLNYVTLLNGGVNTGTGHSDSSTQSLTGTVVGNIQVQNSLKVTATATTTNGFTANESISPPSSTPPSGGGSSQTSQILQGTFGISDTSTTSTAQSTTVTYNTQTTTVLGKQSVASTSISDTSGNTNVPVQVVQDSVFQGIAVRDPQMTFKPGITIKPCPPSGGFCPWNHVRPLLLKTPRPTDTTGIISAYHAAAHRHTARPIPPPPPGGIIKAFSPALLARVKSLGPLDLPDPASQAALKLITTQTK